MYFGRIALGLSACTLLWATAVHSQGSQWPSLAVCSNQHVSTKIDVDIAGRKDEHHTGHLQASASFFCENGKFTNQNLELHPGELTGSLITDMSPEEGAVTVSSIGSPISPTVFASGTCKAKGEYNGPCRFWIMYTSNSYRDGYLSFLVSGAKNEVLAHATTAVNTLTVEDK
jgi:hypothetical protein